MADDRAALEDDALALAGGNTEVGLARLARAVHHAAKDADLDRRRAASKAFLHLGDDAFEVDL